jgi:hypothetical protein
MKKTLLLNTIILFLSFGLFAQNTTTLDPERNKTELLIGFNRRSDTGTWWTDASFKTLVAEMNPDIVRYPGGTQANYWDWQTGKFLDNTSKTWGTKEVLKIPEFMNVLPDRTKIIYVVNLARPTPATGIAVTASEKILKSNATLNLKIDDMLAAIAEFVTEGKTPYAIELGNEFFFGNEESGIFHIEESGGKYYSGWDTANNTPYEHDDKQLATETNVKFYLNQCKEVVSQIIAVYPTMKFALISTKGGSSSRDRWNNTVYYELQNNSAYATLANDIYALTQHHYLNDKYPIDPADETPISDAATAKIAIAEGISYPRDKQADYDQSPNEYKIWYTEYGVTKTNAEETWAGGLRSVAFILSWIDLGDKIGQLDYHYISDNNVVKVDSPMKLAPIGIASSLMALASADMTTMQKINFETNPDVVAGIKSLHGYKFKSPEKETLFIINIDENVYKNIKIDNLFSYSGAKKFTQYWSYNPFQSGVYKGHTNIKSQIDDPFITDTFKANKFSITVVEVLNANITLGIDDVQKNELKLYPNPVKNILTISSIENINTIHVFDITGKQVLFIKNPSKNIDLSNLKPAMYILKIVTKKGVLVKKLIKI